MWITSPGAVVQCGKFCEIISFAEVEITYQLENRSQWLLLRAVSTIGSFRQRLIRDKLLVWIAIGSFFFLRCACNASIWTFLIQLQTFCSAWRHFPFLQVFVLFCFCVSFQSVAAKIKAQIKTKIVESNRRCSIAHVHVASPHSISNGTFQWTRVEFIITFFFLGNFFWLALFVSDPCTNSRVRCENASAESRSKNKKTKTKAKNRRNYSSRWLCVDYS